MIQVVANKQRRAQRIRKKIVGTSARPRLSVYRSNRYVTAQLIDDVNRKTLLTVTEKHIDSKEKQPKTGVSHDLGIVLAKLAKEKKITEVTFDKGRYAYHGRVKAIADGAREGGLIF